MHLSWPPPAAYPVALKDGVVYIPDFQYSMKVGSMEEVRTYIHADLRRRKLERQALPFASSLESMGRLYPDGDVIIISTDGWENPGPLAVEIEE